MNMVGIVPKRFDSGYWQDYSLCGRQERYGMKIRKEGEGAAKTKKRLMIINRLQNRYPTPREIVVVFPSLDSSSSPSKAPTPLDVLRGAVVVDETDLYSASTS